MTTVEELESLRFPIGRFEAREGLSDEEHQALIEDLARLPGELGAAVADLSDDQLDTPYRPGGWTIRQVVHHLPDSHMNSYIRFKLAATEQEPLVRAYDEAAWAELPDARTGGIEVSLALLEALTRRWVAHLRALRREDFQRVLRHPELGPISVAWTLQLYAWHGRHHLAHVTGLRERMGW